MYARLYADFKLFVNIFDFDLIMKTTLFWNKTLNKPAH